MTFSVENRNISLIAVGHWLLAGGSFLARENPIIEPLAINIHSRSDKSNVSLKAKFLIDGDQDGDTIRTRNRI